MIIWGYKAAWDSIGPKWQLGLQPAAYSWIVWVFLLEYMYLYLYLYLRGYMGGRLGTALVRSDHQGGLQPAAYSRLGPGLPTSLHTLSIVSITNTNTQTQSQINKHKYWNKITDTQTQILKHVHRYTDINTQTLKLNPKHSSIITTQAQKHSNRITNSLTLT